MDQIVRFEDARGIGIGVRTGAEIRRVPDVVTLSALLRMQPDEARVVLSSATETVDAIRLLPPVDGLTEVWGGGVTYNRSLEARVEESESSDVYDRVYLAERPELFFKSPAWRVRTHGDEIGIRSDSELNVPEPELALWVTARGQILGYLICNDMTSRSVEAANPLYLPQAKVYSGSCSLSVGIVPAWELENAAALEISMTIVRNGETIWTASTSTAQMTRSFEQLVEWLYAETDFPDGAILSTGTGIVPEMDFVLNVDDEIHIDIHNLGRLSNIVARRSVSAPAALVG